MPWIAALRALTAPSLARAERRLLRELEREVAERLRSLPRAERERLRRLAASLPPLRRRLVELTGAPRSCARCADRTPWGGSTLPGGLCCSGSSEAIFTLVELAPLVLTGRAPGGNPLADPHLGCIFRSTTGCLLPAEGRPSICLGHLCHELAGELHARGVIGPILATAEELATGTRRIGEALGLEPQIGLQQRVTQTSPPPQDA